MNRVAGGDDTSHTVVTYTSPVHGVDCDLMGHLNTARSAAIFDSATWRMLQQLGYQWHRDGELDWVDVKNVIQYEREVPVDSVLRVVSRVTRVGEKSITLLHELQVGEPWMRATTFEVVLVQFDTRRRCSAAIPPAHRAEIIRYLAPL